jgi:NAD-dependent SIR2 family protein deacetylase
MRFRENGADIPAELLNAVSNGDTIFLCGAGVSKRAGLPLFDELTAQIYDAIGERRVDVAAERRAFDRAEYDRALRSLEKRTLLPRAPSRVRSAVSELKTGRRVGGSSGTGAAIARRGGTSQSADNEL